MSDSALEPQQRTVRRAVPRTARRRSRSRRPFLAALGVLTLVLAAVPATAQAATQVFKQTFREYTVDGYGSTNDGCTASATTLNAGDTTVLYSSWSVNSCTGEALYLYGRAAPTTFDVRGNLATAHVVATIPLTNVDTGEPAGQIVVDETWTATQQATKGTYSYTTNLPGEYRYSSRSKGNVAPATVTGTLALDDGNIWKITMMEVSVTHV
jgi:hypothetical protein